MMDLLPVVASVEVDRDHLHVGAVEAGLAVEAAVDRDLDPAEEEDHLLGDIGEDPEAAVSVQAALAVDPRLMVKVMIVQ